MSGLQENLKSTYAHDAIVLAGIENRSVREISLTQGRVALVDADDYEWLNQWKWTIHVGRKYPYAARNSHSKIIKMHRLILGITDPLIWKDHVNRCGIDNRRVNLRIAEYTLNARNASMRVDNKSGLRGVCWNKRSQKWVAQIFVNKKVISCGYYSDIKEAAMAYDKAALRFRGNEAELNFPEKKGEYDVQGDIRGETGAYYRAHRGKGVMACSLAIQSWS